MLVNLSAEMVRFNISINDVARVINKTPRATKNRINGTVEITSDDIRTIRDAFFKHCTLDYLLDETPWRINTNNPKTA